MRALLHEHKLPAVIAQAHEVAVVVPVEELVTRPFTLTLQRRHQVVTVQMHLEGLVAGGVAGQQLRLDVRLASGRHPRWYEIFQRSDVVDLRAGFDDAGPAAERWDAIAALPVGVLLVAERGRAAVGPGKNFGSVVGGIYDDGILFESQFLELV